MLISTKQLFKTGRGNSSPRNFNCQSDPFGSLSFLYRRPYLRGKGLRNILSVLEIKLAKPFFAARKLSENVVSKHVLDKEYGHWKLSFTKRSEFFTKSDPLD